MTWTMAPPRRCRWILFALLAWLIVGCAQPAAPSAAPPSPGSGTAAAPAQPAPSPAPQTMRITIPAVAELGHAVLQLGVKNGYFAEEGLAPDFMLATGQIGIKALVAGEYDASLAVGSATQAILNGAPLKIAHVVVGRPLWWVYGRDPVRSLKDLQGRTLGVGAISDPSNVGTNLIMEKQGLDPRTVTAIAMGPPAQRYEGLLGGAVDAAVLILPDNLRADDEGFHNLAAFADYFQLAMTGMTVREDALAAKGPLLSAYMRAANKSIERFRANKDEAVAASVDVLQLSQAQAERLHDELAAALPKDGLVDQDTQSTTIKMYGTAIEGIDPQSIPLTKVFDLSLAERVASGAR